MSNPHVYLDPDPLSPGELDLAYADGFAAGMDEAVATARSLSVEGLLALVLAALSGALVGAALMWVVR